MASPKNQVVFEEGEPGQPGAVKMVFDKDDPNLSMVIAKTINSTQMILSDLRDYLEVLQKKEGEKV